jgi:diguanylate cyclase (GGDEF)-like protein
MQGIGSVPGHNHPVLHSEVLSVLNIELFDIEVILEHVDNEMRTIQSFYGADFPHHNLNPDDFVPQTLEAIHQDFAFDRVKMLSINPKRRSLSVSYSWPVEEIHTGGEPSEIIISSASADLLKCLRLRKAVLIKNTSLSNKKVLNQQPVEEYMVVPVLRHNRFIGVLYVDNVFSEKKLDVSCLNHIVPIANELGIALNNAKQLATERKRSLTDALTNLNNRRMISEFLEDIYPNKLDQFGLIAVGFIDIDFFKRFNDSCGHQAGDDALKIVADILRSLTRPGDCVGRYGGEEFVFIQLNTTLEGVKGYAERIRAEVERRGKILSRKIECAPLTVSIGVVMHSSSYRSYYDIVDAADKAMYQAKSEGRNRVVFNSA